MTLAHNGWNNLKEPKCFSSKVVSNIDEKNQTLRLLSFTFTVNLVVGLDL